MTHHVSIKNWANEDRPREKLIDKGAQALTNAELLAILINTGTKNLSALDIAKQLLQIAGQDLINFAQLDLNDLKNVKGLGPKKAVTLLAAIELGRRGKLAQALQRTKVSSSRDAYEVISPYFTNAMQEHCFALFLDQGNQVVQVTAISAGGLTATVVDPRIIFSKALALKNVTQIIVAHNHPSGNITPSQADKNITRKLIDGGKLLDLAVIDHLIIGNNKYYSFADEAMMV